MPPETKQPVPATSPDNGNEAEAADKSRRNSEANKRIAKNTLALYFRQVVVMGVSLFTVRIVLETLGVTDYGIHNVVGGVVAMFGFLRSPLVNITQRFLNVEMGKGNNDALPKIFSTSLMLHAAVGIVIIILGETVGLWFVENKLVILAERMQAARWVYQFAVLGFLVTMIQVPFEALIIAHEDMRIYGYVGIFDAGARLVIAYLLLVIGFDKLAAYAVFNFLTICLIALFYSAYCWKKYTEAKFSFHYDITLIKELGKYGGYVFGHQVLELLRKQGINIILNVFYGPAVNAARGLALSVDGAFLMFRNNFVKALVPQLTKMCAGNDKKNMWNLLERGTRFSYFLILIFSVPVLLKTEFLLGLWLKNVPEYTAVFARLIIIYALINSICALLFNIIDANGKLRAFYSIHFAYLILTFALSYVICKMGYAPSYVLAIPLPLFLLSMPLRFFVMKKLINFSIRFFTRKALVPIFMVSAVSYIPFYIMDKLFTTESFLYSCAIITASLLWTGAVIMYMGMRKNERAMAFGFVRRKVFK